MFINPVSLISTMSPEAGVFFLSMLPITELRASIPIGLTVFNLPVWKTYLLAVSGNMFPTIFILLLMPKLHKWLLAQKFVGDVLKRKLQQAEEKFSGNHAKYGVIALILFVGIPLPLTGAWSGCLVAFIFNIPFKKSFPLIFTGICLAAAIVTVITLGAGGVLRLFS